LGIPPFAGAAFRAVSVTLFGMPKLHRVASENPIRFAELSDTVGIPTFMMLLYI
jgi:hypothetical protein